MKNSRLPLIVIAIHLVSLFSFFNIPKMEKKDKKTNKIVVHTETLPMPIPKVERSIKQPKPLIAIPIAEAPPQPIQKPIEQPPQKNEAPIAVVTAPKEKNPPPKKEQKPAAKPTATPAKKPAQNTPKKEEKKTPQSTPTKTPPKKAPLPKKETAVQKHREELLSLMKEGVSTMDKASNKLKKASPAPSQGSFSKIDKLQSESFQAAIELSYAEELALYLKHRLRFPDEGMMKISLTLNREGKISTFKILSSSSNKNQEIAQKSMPSITFPSFGDKFKGETSKSFSIVLNIEGK